MSDDTTTATTAEAPPQSAESAPFEPAPEPVAQVDAALGDPAPAVTPHPAANVFPVMLAIFGDMANAIDHFAAIVPAGTRAAAYAEAIRSKVDAVRATLDSLEGPQHDHS